MEYHDGKDGLAASAQVVEDGFVGDPGLSPEKAGTLYDQKDMARVGKTQELRVGRILLRVKFRATLANHQQRNFRFISILGFTAVLMCTWEAVLM
jgi:choline transport protein